MDTAGTSTTAGPETSDTQAIPCTLDSDCPEPIEICVDNACVDDPEICGYGQITKIPFSPPNVVFVIDKSTSMFAPENHWDEDGDDLDDDGFQDDDPMQMATPKVSRWSSARRSVDILDDSPRVGAMLFPNVNAPPSPGPDGCIVIQNLDVPLAVDNTQLILETIPGNEAMGLGGLSPATQALVATYAHLQSFSQINVVVLITDGVPDCAPDAPPGEVELYDDSFIPAIEQAHAMDIATVIVGVDISSAPDPQGIVAHEVLNAAAQAGGLPSTHPSEKYYSPRRLDDLAWLFETEEGGLVCTFELWDAPPGDIRVRVGEQDFSQLDSDTCGDASGIAIKEGDPFTFELCGDACTLYEELGDLEFFYLCDAP